jgi:hypothetical protein
MVGAAIAMPVALSSSPAAASPLVGHHWGDYHSYLDCYNEGEYLVNVGHFYKDFYCGDTGNGSQTPWSLTVWD